MQSIYNLAVEAFIEEIGADAAYVYGKLVKAFDDTTNNKPCSGTILCERTGKRHRNGCYGRTEPFATYARKVVQ